MEEFSGSRCYGVQLCALWQLCPKTMQNNLRPRAYYSCDIPEGGVCCLWDLAIAFRESLAGSAFCKHFLPTAVLSTGLATIEWTNRPLGLHARKCHHQHG